MITRIETDALKAVSHYLPQIANSLSRIANSLEALSRAVNNPLVNPPEDKDEEY